MSGKPFPRPADPKPMQRRRLRRIRFTWLPEYLGYKIIDRDGAEHFYTVTIDADFGGRVKS